MSSRPVSPRPVSPHLSIYRWLMTNTLSILHRITGMALTVGSLLFAMWLVSAAYWPAFYGALHGFLASILGQLMMIGWAAAFYYHLFNGLRHLWWDTGRGVEYHACVRQGYMVLAATAVFTVLTIFIAYFR